MRSAEILEVEVDCEDEEMNTEELETASQTIAELAGFMFSTPPQHDDSPEGILNRKQFRELKALAQVTEVTIPMNGHCLPLSLYATTANRCATDLREPLFDDLKEAQWFRTFLSEKVVEFLPVWFERGTFCVEHLWHYAFPGTEVPPNARDLLSEHYIAASKLLVTTSVGREFWGGEPEIKAYVMDGGRPVYVFEVLPNGTTFVEQHVREPLNPDDILSPLTVRTRLLSVAQTMKHLLLYREHKVIPIMLVLHHSMTPEGENTSHYQALRFPQRDYDAWGSTIKKVAAMQRRLQDLLTVLEWNYAVERQRQGHKVSVPAAASQGNEDSLCGQSSKAATPDSRASSDHTVESSACNVAVKVETPAIARRTAIMIDVPTAEVQDVNLSTPRSVEVVTALNGSTASQYVDPFHQATSAVATMLPPDDRISLEEHEDLLLQLRSKSEITKIQSRTLRKGVKANLAAYLLWLRQIKTRRPAIGALLKTVKDVAVACEALLEHPIQLVEMLRALPYAKMQLALSAERFTPELGRALTCIGRIQMLNRLIAQPNADDPTREDLAQWKSAIQGAAVELKWTIAQNEARWSRLLASSLAVSDPSPLTLPDHDLHRLVAYVIALPACLPANFRASGIPQQCDAFLAWIVHPERAEAAIAVASALKQSVWDNGAGLFPRVESPVSAPAPPTGDEPVAERS